MTFALLAALLIVTCYAVLQHLTIKRLTAPVEAPRSLYDATEMGDALLDVVEASLIGDWRAWTARGSDLIHDSGFRVRVKQGRGPRLFKSSTEIALSEPRQLALMRAIEINNAKDALAALEPNQENSR